MDQRVIKSLNANYRKLQTLKIINSIESNDNMNIDLLDAILLVSKTWERVCTNCVIVIIFTLEIQAVADMNPVSGCSLAYMMLLDSRRDILLIG